MGAKGGEGEEEGGVGVLQKSMVSSSSSDISMTGGLTCLSLVLSSMMTTGSET